MVGGKPVPVTWYPLRPIGAPCPFFSPSTTMGRGRAYRRGHGRGGRGGSKRSGERHGEYTSIEQTNPKFEAYYRDQGIVPLDEWEAFVEAMRAPLPTTFRITSGKPTSRQLLDAMHTTFLPYLSNVTFEGEKVTPPHQLEWYPEGLGWHLDVRKNVLRKSPEFKRFQQFLVHETEEAVSHARRPCRCCRPSSSTCVPSTSSSICVRRRALRRHS